MPLKGAGCNIYEAQAHDRHCRACPDRVCIARWQKVEQRFPMGREVELTDVTGAIFVTRRASAKRPLSVRWQKPEGNGWDKSSLLLYWKSLDQGREYRDPDDHTQPKRVA